MKALMMATTVIGTLAAGALTADAQAIRFGERNHGYSVDFAPRHYREMQRTEQVLVGYRDEIVGYRDVWVERPVTVYETRTVYREIFVGYDHCRRPIYRCRPVQEQVAICRTQRVCEQQPICEKRPVYETRDVACREPDRSPRGHSFTFGR